MSRIMLPTPKRSKLSVALVFLCAFSAMSLAVACDSVSDRPSANSANSVSASAVPDTANTILGDGNHFDPIVAYPAIAKYAGSDLQLSSIHIYYVRSDGTLDLNAKSYQPHVYYYFFERMDGRPTDAPPVGAGGKLNERWYLPVDVDVTAPSHAGDKPELRRYEGKATNDTQQAIPAPTCSVRRLWSVALEKGAPPDAVATIDYGDNGYYFRISDTSVSLSFDFKCQLTRGTGLTPEPVDTLVTISPPQ